MSSIVNPSAGGGGGGVSRDGANTVWMDDFMAVTNSGSVPDGEFRWLTGNSGSGSNINTNTATLDANTVGMAAMTTGTTTTGVAAIYSGPAQIRFGGGSYTLAIRFQFPSLLDGTESGSVYLGFGDNAGGAFVDGAYLYWDNTQTNFRYRTRNNSTQTDVDSSLAPAAGTWYKLQITVNAAGTNVNFTINGANSQDITTNIPTAAGRETGVLCQIIKSAGTTARQIYLDYVRLAIAMTSRT